MIATYKKKIQKRKYPNTLNLRTRKPDLRFDILLVQGECFGEHASEFPDLLLEGLFVGPGNGRVEKFARNTLEESRY